MTFNGLSDKQILSSKSRFGKNSKAITKISFREKFLSLFKSSAIRVYFTIIILSFGAIILDSIYHKTYNNLYNSLDLLLYVFVILLILSINLVLELKSENRFLSKESVFDEEKINTYRCGNEIVSVEKSELVVGDYIFLEHGDVIPVNAKILWGDVTIESSTGNRFIRVFDEKYLDKDNVNDENTDVIAGEIITSGYAVLEITSFSPCNVLSLSHKRDKSYKFSMIFGAIAFSAMMVLSAIFSGEALSLYFIAKSVILFSGFIPLASARFRSIKNSIGVSNVGKIYDDGVFVKKFIKKPNLLFVEKCGIFTDGKAYSSDFVDGLGKTYDRFSEIPYPLGTLLSLAIVDNATAYVNRGNVFSYDAYLKSETRYIFERISKTINLEIDPLTINGADRGFKYKSLLRGSPERILKYCKYYYNSAGEVLEFDKNNSIHSVADNLELFSSKVIAYSAIDDEERHVFIGMIAFREPFLSGSSEAISELKNSGVKTILISDGISHADRILFEAGGSNIISAGEIERMSDEELEKIIPELKIITGRVNYERLLEVSQKIGFKPALALDKFNRFDDATEKIKPYIYYSSGKSSSHVRNLSSVIFSGGITSIAKFMKFNTTLSKFSSLYFAIHILIISCSFVAMYFLYESVFAVGIIPIAILLSLILKIFALSKKIY